MARDINLGPTGGPFVNIQENSGDLDITGASDVDLNGANLTNAGIKRGFDTIDVFTADGTFDASNVDKAFVEVVGGGGGGAGEVSGDPIGGAAGGGGGYAAAVVDLSATNSITVTVGTGGAGGASGENPGSNGGNTTFGTLVETGGGNGAPAAVPDATSPTAAGSGITGDITIDGGRGESKVGGYTNTGSAVEGAAGGGTVYSNGTASPKPASTPTTVNGFNGDSPGGGGSGGVTTGGNGSSAGGDGADGIVIVRY
jgi:hypothetical protein